MDDHKRGCEGRNYTCICGYDDEIDLLKESLQGHIMTIGIQEDEIKRMRAIESAVRRLAYVVRKSVNSGPLSRDPTSEAEAWRAVRLAIGEGYDERGNLVPVVGK